MGTYPSFSFNPSDDAIIIWATGQIYTVPLATNVRGERVRSSTAPFPIPFIAHIEKRLAETLRVESDVLKMETQDTQRVHAFKELRVDESGRRAVFQAAGTTYVQGVGKKDPIRVPVLHNTSPYYSPSFVSGADNLILHARWSDSEFSSFELADLHSGIAHELQGLPLGRYFSPILCECRGSQRQIAFVKSGGDLLTGDIVATANVGLYIGDITPPPKDAKTSYSISIRNLHFVPSEIDSGGRVDMRFLDGNKKLLVQQSSRAFVIDLGAGADENGSYPHSTLASGQISKEIVVSLKPGRKGKEGYTAGHIAFVDFFDIYLASGKHVAEDEAVWSKPGNATTALTRLSLDGGHDLTFSPDGKKVFWFLGKFITRVQESADSAYASYNFQGHSYTHWRSPNCTTAAPKSPATDRRSAFRASSASSTSKRSLSSIPPTLRD